MVGTNNMSCTSCATIASSTPCGLKDGTITWVEPDRFPANTALKSAIWNIGAECSRRPATAGCLASAFSTSAE
ncbi:Uncharacterised protein [Mycobacteroides abscessus subsp. abscessus]|nr:Uncharacterised protein [Mycobacteroides abscessus subsp. abscessus]